MYARLWVRRAVPSVTDRDRRRPLYHRGLDRERRASAGVADHERRV